MERSPAAPLYLAFDFGTSSLRAVVGAASGPPLAVARRAVNYYRPPGTPDTALEFDPQRAWLLALEAAAEAIWASGAVKERIKGVGATSQRHGLVLLDEAGRELYAGPNKDLRGVFQGGMIDDRLGAKLWESTGHGPGFMTAWARLLWMEQEAPSTFENVAAACGIADWLAYRLSGELTLNSALAPELGLALVSTGEPADAIATLLELDRFGLPAACSPGDVVGLLSGGVAGELGLTPGTPVVSAGPDTQAALVGMGVAEPGAAGVAAGWSAAVQTVTEKPVFDPARSTWTGRHVVPGRWTLEGNAGEMGGAFEWLAAMLSGSPTGSAELSALDDEAARVEPGARGAYAFLGPSFISMADVGIRRGGLIFPVPLSFEPPGRGTLARAALESFAFALRLNLERLARHGGPFDSVSIGGGMTRSSTFLEALSNTVETPMTVCTDTEPAALGTITLTAAAVDDGPCLQEGLSARRIAMRESPPDAVLSEQYGDLYEEWKELERRLGAAGE